MRDGTTGGKGYGRFAVTADLGVYFHKRRTNALSGICCNPLGLSLKARLLTVRGAPVLDRAALQSSCRDLAVLHSGELVAPISDTYFCEIQPASAEVSFSNACDRGEGTIFFSG